MWYYFFSHLGLILQRLLLNKFLRLLMSWDMYGGLLPKCGNWLENKAY